MNSKASLTIFVFSCSLALGSHLGARGRGGRGSVPSIPVERTTRHRFVVTVIAHASPGALVLLDVRQRVVRVGDGARLRHGVGYKRLTSSIVCVVEEEEQEEEHCK